MEQYKLAKLYDAGGDLSDQWYVYYSFVHPESKQFTRFKKTLSNKLLTKAARYSSAQATIKKINIWLRQGNSPFDDNNTNVSLVSALDAYIISIKNKVRIRTFHSYSCYANKLKAFLEKKGFENIKVSGFTLELANQFLNWAKNEGKVSNRTHNNIKDGTSTIFKYFILQKYTDINPFTSIAKLQEEEAEITCLTPTELQAMKKHMPEENYSLYAISLLVFYCFLRPQEIVRLKVENIDLMHQRIRLGGKTTKNKKTQVVVIPDPLVEVLVNLRNLNAPSESFIFSNRLQSGTVEIAPTRIAEIWRKWADKYDISKQIYHLKHTGVGMAIEAGINVRDLQLQLRHSSLDETQKYLEKFNNVASDRLKSNFPRF